MTKPQVAPGIIEKNTHHQNYMPERFKRTSLRTSMLSLATAVGALGFSQLACAELTWGDSSTSSSTYQQEGKYQVESYQPESYKPDGYTQNNSQQNTFQQNSSQQNSGYQPDNGVGSFTAAAIAAERGDVNALYNYEQAMSGGLFAMYPTYWRMNLDLNSQSSAAVSQFVRQ